MGQQKERENCKEYSASSHLFSVEPRPQFFRACVPISHGLWISLSAYVCVDSLQQ